MSDIGDLHIKTTLDIGDAASASAILRSSLSQLTTQIASYANAVQKASNIQKNLDFITQRSSNSLGILASRQSAVSQAVQGTNVVVQGAVKNLEALNRTMAIVGASGGPKLIANLQAQQSQLQAVAGSAKNLESALRSASLSQWANKSRASLAQANRSFYGFSAATLPLIRGLRTAFFSFADLETQTVRYTKLVSDNYGNSVEKAAAATAVLSKQLDQVTARFGVSRVLVQAIAGDFAELGVTQTDAVRGLVELTAIVEKLGNVDIQQSQKFIESILQNILRVKRDAGEIVDLTDAKFMSNVIAELRGQIAEFNLIENKTTLSLKDMADAFPEVSAAATTFGLSMSETMAVLAPMVAAGYQVGASANSIKVSLQRMVAMTKQNTQIIGDLNKALGPDFDYASGVSMKNIQRLTDGFNKLQESYGEQGVLELFARLYGVRQGPRMETTFRQLAKFQTSLSTVGTIENRIASTIERNVNTRLKAYNGEEIAVRNMIDISNLSKKSNEEVNGVLTERAKIIKEGQKQAFDDLSKFNTESADFLSQVSSESGKILLSTAFRIEDTAVAQMETEIDLQLSTTITKFRILKESVIEIGRVFVTAFKPLIEFLIPIVSKIKDFFNSLGEGSKRILSFVTVIALLVPGFKLLTTAVKFFGISAFLGFSKLTSSLTGVGNKLITVEDLFTKGTRAMRGYKEAIQFTDNSILLSGRKRGNMPSLSGLSLPVQEKLMQANLVPGFGTDNKLLKSFFGKNAPDLNMPSTMQVAKTLNESGDAVKTAAKSVKNGAASVASAAEKASEDIAESIANSFKNNTFINNKFIGNNQFGDGTSGRGPNGVRGGPSGGPQTTPAAPPITTPVTTPSGIPATPVPNRPGAVENTLQQTLARLNDKLKQIKFLPVGAPADLEQLIPPARLDPTQYLKRSSGDLGEFVKRMKINLAGLTPFPFMPKSIEDVGQLVPPSLQKLALPRGVPTSLEQVIPPSLQRLALPKVATVISQTAAKATDMVDLHLYELLDVYRKLDIPIPDELQYLNGVQRSFNVTQRQKNAVLEKLAARIKEQENLIKDEIKLVAKEQGLAGGSYLDPNLRRAAVQRLQASEKNVTFPFADITGTADRSGPGVKIASSLVSGKSGRMKNIVASKLGEVDKIVMELIARHVQAVPVNQLPFFTNLEKFYGKAGRGIRLTPGAILNGLKRLTEKLQDGTTALVSSFFDESAVITSDLIDGQKLRIRNLLTSKFLDAASPRQLEEIAKQFPQLKPDMPDFLPRGVVKGPLLTPLTSVDISKFSKDTLREFGSVIQEGALVPYKDQVLRSASKLGEALHKATADLVDEAFTGRGVVELIDDLGYRTRVMLDTSSGIVGKSAGVAGSAASARMRTFTKALMQSVLPKDDAGKLITNAGGKLLTSFQDVYTQIFSLTDKVMDGVAIAPRLPKTSTISDLLNFKEEADAVEYILNSRDEAIRDLLEVRSNAIGKGSTEAVFRSSMKSMLPENIDPESDLARMIRSQGPQDFGNIMPKGLDARGLGVQLTGSERDLDLRRVAAARDIASKMRNIGDIKRLQVLEAVLLEERIQKILNSVDENVKIALQEEIGAVQSNIRTPGDRINLTQRFGSIERTAAANMASRQGLDLRRFNPASELYDDAAEGVLLRNKKIVDAVKSGLVNMGTEGEVLTATLNSMIDDSTPELVQARRGFVKVFREKFARLALPTGPVGKTIGGLTKSIAEYVSQLESLGAIDPAVPVHRFKTQAIELFRRKLPAVFDSRNILGMLPARFIGGVGEVVDNFKKVTLEQVIPQQLALPRITGFGRGEVSKALKLSQFVKRMQDVMVQDMISNLEKLIPAVAPPAGKMPTTAGVRRTFSGIFRNLPVISGGSQLAGLSDAALASAKTVGDGLDNFLKQIFAQFPMDTDAKKIFARVAAEVLSRDAMGPTATLMAREATLAGQKVADSFDFRGIPLTNVVKNNLKKALDSIAPALYEAIDLSLNKGMRIEKGDFTAVTAPDGETFSKFKKKAKEMFTSDTMKSRVSKFKKLASNLKDLSLVTQGALIDAVQAGAYAATAEAGETAESAVRKTLLARARQAGVNIKALKGFKWFDSTLQEALAALSANLSALRDDVAKDIKTSSKKISEAAPQIGVDAGTQQPADGDPAPKPARKPRVSKVTPTVPDVTQPIKEASNKVSKALALTADEIAKQAEIFKATFGEYPAGYQPPKPVIPATAVPATTGAAAGATVQEVFNEVKQDIANPIDNLAIETKKSSDKISGAIQKQILEFDESLANFFKGPNLFQGPNIFQGPIQSGDNYDIKTVRRKGPAADVAQAAAARGAVAQETVANLTPSTATVEMLKARNATKKLREMERRRTERGMSPMTAEQIARAKQLLGIQDQVTLAAQEMVKQMTFAQRVAEGLRIKSAAAFSKLASSISSANQSLIKTIPGLKSFEAGLASIAGLGVSKAIGNTVKQTLLLQGAMLKAVAAEAGLFVSSLGRSKSLKALLFFATAGFSALGKSIFGASKNLISFTKQQGFAGGIKNAIASLTGGIAKTGFSIAGLIIKFGAIGIIVIPIIIMIGSLFKQLKGGLTNIEPVMNNFRAAWATIKEAISAIASPFKDFINSLMGLDGLETQTAKTAGVLYSLSLAVLRISRAFKSFAEGPLQSFIGKMREATDQKTVGTLIPFLTRMINRFILTWEAFSSGFKGNTDEMKESLKALGYSLLYDVIGFVQAVISALAVSMPYLGKLWELIMAGIVKAFEYAMISVLYLFSATLDAMKDMFANSWIGNIYGEMLKVTNFVAIPLLELTNPRIPDNIRYPEQLREIAEAERELAQATTDSGKKTAQARLKEATGRLASVKGNKDSLESIIATVKKASSKLTTSIFDADLGTKLGEFAKRGLQGLASALGQMRTGLATLYQKETGKNIDVALRRRLAGAVEAEIVRALAKAAAKANAAGQSLGKGVGDSINKGIASLKEDFGMKVFSNADSLMEKFVENMKTNLDSQKDKALEAFDQQIESIEALADAEERLTAKMEYEEKRRELIKSKELDRENYLRERKVAAYEGRTEDVRGLDLAFRKSSKDAQKDLSDLDLERRKELQAEQRGLAIAVINKQKDELTREYEKMFKEFELRLDRIKTRGFSTEEEFAGLLKDLGSAGTKFSEDLAKTFEASMLSLPSAIKSVTDPAIGMFTIVMDKLVLEAKNHFGSSTGVPDVNSVLGAAYALVTGLPNTFKQAFNNTLVATYVTPFADKLKSDLATVVPRNLWVEAGITAVNELMNEMKRQIRAKMTGPDSIWEEFKKIFAELDPATVPNFADFFPMPDPGVDPFEGFKKRIKELMTDLAALKAELVIIDDLANKDSDDESSGPKAPEPLVDPYALPPGFFTGKSGIGGGLPDFSQLPEFYRYNAKTRAIQVKISAMTKEQLDARGIDSEAAARINRFQGGYVDESADVLQRFSYAGKQGVLKGLVSNPGMQISDSVNKGVFKYLMPNVTAEAETVGKDIAKSVKGGFDTEIKVDLPSTKDIIGEYNELNADSPNLGSTGIDTWIDRNIRPAIKNAKEKGREIAKSLKDGIIEAFGSPSEWIDFKSWWGRLISIVKAIFGIESPSKVFFGIGRDIMQGLINGIASLSATPAAIIATAFGGIKTKIEEIASAVTTKWSTEISPKLVEWRDYVANNLSTAFDTARNKWTDLASGFKTGYDNYISPTVSKMKGFLTGEQGLGTLVSNLKEGFGKIPSSFNSGWNAFVEKWNLNVVGGLVKQLGAKAKDALGFVAAKLNPFYTGGKVGAFTGSGPTPGFPQQGVPALLHGGEYVLNHKVVEKIGRGPLDELNSLRHGGYYKGGKVPGGRGGGVARTADGAERRVLASRKAAANPRRTIGLTADSMESIIGRQVKKTLGITADSAEKRIGRVIPSGSADSVATQRLNERAAVTPALRALSTPVTPKDTRSGFQKVLGVVDKIKRAEIAIVKGALNIANDMGESLQATFINPFINTGGQLIGKNPNLRQAGLVESIVNTADVVATAFTAGGSKAITTGGQVGIKAIISALAKGSVETAGQTAARKAQEVATKQAVKAIANSGRLSLGQSAKIGLGMVGKDMKKGTIFQDGFKGIPKRYWQQRTPRPTLNLPASAGSNVPRTIDALPYNYVPGVDDIKTGMIDRNIMQLFDELDVVVGGKSLLTESSDVVIRRLTAKAKLQAQGVMPKVLDSEEEMIFWNKYIDDILGLNTGQKSRTQRAAEGDVFMDLARRLNEALSGGKKMVDPRVIPQSKEVAEYTQNQLGLAKRISEYLTKTNRGSGGATREGVYKGWVNQIGKALGLRPHMRNIEQLPELILGKEGIPLQSLGKFPNAFSINFKNKLKSIIPNRSSRSIWKEFFGERRGFSKLLGGASDIGRRIKNMTRGYDPGQLSLSPKKLFKLPKPIKSALKPIKQSLKKYGDGLPKEFRVGAQYKEFRKFVAERLDLSAKKARVDALNENLRITSEMDYARLVAEAEKLFPNANTTLPDGMAHPDFAKHMNYVLKGVDSKDAPSRIAYTLQQQAYKEYVKSKRLLGRMDRTFKTGGFLGLNYVFNKPLEQLLGPLGLGREYVEPASTFKPKMKDKLLGYDSANMTKPHNVLDDGYGGIYSRTAPYGPSQEQLETTPGLKNKLLSFFNRLHEMGVITTWIDPTSQIMDSGSWRERVEKNIWGASRDALTKGLGREAAGSSFQNFIKNSYFNTMKGQGEGLEVFGFGGKYESFKNLLPAITTLPQLFDYHDNTVQTVDFSGGRLSSIIKKVNKELSTILGVNFQHSEYPKAVAGDDENTLQRLLYHFLRNKRGLAVGIGGMGPDNYYPQFGIGGFAEHREWLINSANSTSPISDFFDDYRRGIHPKMGSVVQMGMYVASLPATALRKIFSVFTPDALGTAYNAISKVLFGAIVPQPDMLFSGLMPERQRGDIKPTWWDKAKGVVGVAGQLAGEVLGSEARGPTNILRHEMGHVFGLPHPHGAEMPENYNKRKESVMDYGHMFAGWGASDLMAWQEMLNGAKIYSDVTGVYTKVPNIEQQVLDAVKAMSEGTQTDDHIKAIKNYGHLFSNIDKSWDDYSERKRGVISRKEGGYIPGAPSTPVPALLHGGEYVLNAEAVRKIGIPALAQLNQAKFSVPQIPSMRIPAPAMQAAGGASSSTQNVNIYVDTFVGEPEWFNSMMKDYNTRVLPRNQKAAGLQNRTISTYNGLNKGG